MQQDCLERAQQGDAEAFARLFESFRASVFAVAVRLVGPDEADDVVMDTYLRAWQALPGFRGRSAIKSWLYRIAYNASIDAIRKRQRRHEVAAPVDEEGRSLLEEVPDERPANPAGRIELEDERATLEKALVLLAHEHRVTLELRYSEGMSYAEIAAATGVPIGTVMSRLFNGKRRLRQALERLEQEEKAAEDHQP